MTTTKKSWNVEIEGGGFVLIVIFLALLLIMSTFAHSCEPKAEYQWDSTWVPQKHLGPQHMRTELGWLGWSKGGWVLVSASPEIDPRDGRGYRLFFRRARP